MLRKVQDMLNSPASLIFSAAMLGLLVVPDLAQAAAKEKDQTPPDAEEVVELCHKGIKRTGTPSKLSVVAGLSAVRQWTQAAMKFGDNYSMWHNAQSSGVKCEKFENSDYYKCVASGKPCRAASLDQATADEHTN